MSRVSFGVSYFGVRDPRHARRDLDEIAGAGFTSVTHTLSEHDLRYHEGDVARLVEETKRRGLEAILDPWGVAGLFGGEAWSELALVDLDSRQIDARGVSVPASCPNAAATRALLARWTRAAVAMGADALFWDEPHFYLGALRPSPHAACCRCAHCLAAYRSANPGAGGLPPEGDSGLASFRARTIEQLLSELLAIVDDRRIAQTLCLLPHGEFTSAGTDDWESLARIGRWSRLATDPYWMDRPVSPAEFVASHARKLRRLCDATKTAMEIWVQGIRIARGAERAIGDAVDAAVDCGAERVAFWSFRGTERMSSLACADPDAVWREMTAGVRRHA